MRLALLSALLLATPAFAKPPIPVVELRARSLNDLLGLADYAAAIADKPDIGKSVVALADAFTKEKTGLEGIDRTRPFGAYIIAAEGGSPAGAILIPIANEKAFVNLLKTRASADVVGENGSYAVDLPNVPTPIYLAFHDGYAFAAPLSADWVGEANRVDPKAFFATKMPAKSLVNLTVHLDRIGRESINAVLAQAELKLADERKAAAKKGDTKEYNAGRVFGAAIAFDIIAAVLKEGKSFTADLAVDPKSDDLALIARVIPKPDTTMAKYVKSLAARPGVAVQTLPSDAATVRLNFELPSEARKEWKKATDQLIAESLAEPADDEGEKKAREITVEALRPTIQSGVFNLSFAVGGPNARRLAAIAELVEGKKVESAVRALSPFMPAKEGKLKLDAAKSEGVQLHELMLKEKDEVFGSNGDFWFGITPNRLAVASGDSKDAATLAVHDAKPGPVFEARLFLTQTLALQTEPQKREQAKMATEKVYSGKPSGRDEVTVSLTGGDSLNLAIKMKGKLLAFLNAMGNKGDNLKDSE